MKEKFGDLAESVFGEEGLMSWVFKFGVIVGVAYLGYLSMRSCVSSSKIDEINKIANSPPPVTQSLSTEDIKNLFPQSTQEFSNNSKRRCVNISPEVPNAFRAWKFLGEPGELVFQNIAGPDASNKIVIKDKKGDGIIDDLPWLVHFGDRFCIKE